MAFGQFKDAGKPMTSMSDINVTPMVDVMLVLLVIFIITAPLMTHAIKLELPKAQSSAAPQQAETITLSFDAQGALYLETELLKLSDLDRRLALLAKKNPQPDLLLRADKETRYETIAQVMAAAQAQGLSRIGFATETKSDAKKSDTDKK
jgi:biopolymer transport protein ExbD